VLSNEYQNGALTVNGIARRKNRQNYRKIKWVYRMVASATYSDGRQTEDYLVVMEVVQRNVKLIE
jgi:hypothetical protein